MGKFLKYLFWISCLMGLSHLPSQNNKIDSLLNVLKTAKEDTNKVNTLNELTNKLWRQGKFNEALNTALQEKNLSVKLDFRKGIGMAYLHLGIINLNLGNYSLALDNNSEALKIIKALGDKKGLVSALMNRGNIYTNLGEFKKAIEEHTKVLKVSEEIGD